MRTEEEIREYLAKALIMQKERIGGIRHDKVISTLRWVLSEAD